ncbi:hypothetical protein NG799_26495 [Laspinema sp. D1]|uniref:TtsA-like Glycoside hydrolase family 108 domain-containing protein n=1 Tax=Laspinema palackyanum D2a TaxID=2953684 RepID=A0ABT2N0W2_9CYAN|nr:hypothetical protein [Laspinema sp. D2a]
MIRISRQREDIWTRHEKRVLEIFKLALKMLREESSLPDKEDEINRKLYFLVRRANGDLQTQNQGIEWPITYESNNQPDADDVTRSPRESKRPDFQWGVCDTNELDPNRRDKFYIIESKRLGSPSSTTWILNKNYVVNGMKRFVDPEWSYGKSSHSGAMIGYIQDMELQTILEEVNTNAASELLPNITISSDGEQPDITKLDQKLEREHIQPTPFDLRHLWVDLKHHYKDKDKTNQQTEEEVSKPKQTNKKSITTKKKSSMHLSKCSPGEYQPGQPFGKTGNTGASTGPHLHWESRPDGTKSSAQPPELWSLHQTLTGKLPPRPSSSLSTGFTAAYDWTLGKEGGCSDHPADRGGRTYKGIIRSVAQRHGYDDPCSMPESKIQEIYLKE